MNHLIYRQQYPIIPYPVPGIIPPRRELPEEEDLATVTLQIEKKRFYVDVKKNCRGRFMKIAEVGLDGRKARILLTMTAADDLKDKLLDLVEVYEELLKQSPSGDDSSPGKLSDGTEDGLIKSHILNYPHRRYYLDLKLNRRGYFLRLTMLCTNARVKLAIPGEGIRTLYSSLCDLLNTWWTPSVSSSEQKVNLPEPRALRIDKRTLYFDSVANRHGVFLRISQVWASSRTAITIPGRCLNKFRDIIAELAEGMADTTVSDDNMNSDSKLSSNEAEEPCPDTGDAASA